MIVGLAALPRADSFPAVKVPPIDASRDDADLARLKATLLAAARAKSVAMLEPVMTDEFRLALHTFKKREDAVGDLNAGIYRNFWRGLEDALMHGLSLTESGSAVAPYGMNADVKCEVPPGTYCAVVMGTDVAVRAAPRLSAPVVGTVSNELVGTMEPEVVRGATDLIGSHRYQWMKIVTSSGKVGFVSEKFLAEEFGLTFLFEKVNGQWRFAGMTSGD